MLAGGTRTSNRAAVPAGRYVAMGMWSRSPTHTNRGTDCHRDARSNRHHDAGTHFYSYADLDTNAVLYAYPGAPLPRLRQRRPQHQRQSPLRRLR